MRIPEWVAPRETTCMINGRERGLDWDGRYALVGVVTAGQVVELKFPIYERVEDVHIEKQRYILTIKGNDVVDINPPGKYGPLYERDYYREDVTRWKKIDRFVSAQDINW